MTVQVTEIHGFPLVRDSSGCDSSTSLVLSLLHQAVDFPADSLYVESAIQIISAKPDRACLPAYC